MGSGRETVCCGISFRQRRPLIVIHATLTSQRYINEVLRPSVVPFFAAYLHVTQDR